MWRTAVNVTGRTAQAKLGNKHSGYYPQTSYSAWRQHHELGFVEEKAGIESTLAEGTLRMSAGLRPAQMSRKHARMMFTIARQLCLPASRDVLRLLMADVIAKGLN